MQNILQKYFGYEDFREGQREIIENILNKCDTLAIMPTGAGKSVCFQVPALKFQGITLVVSPLISLMKDQVMTLISMGVKAAYINSSLNQTQIKKALENARNNHYKIIYVAPERLLTREFLNFAINSEISMITIDEAHCISQWGNDFRKSYLDIPEFVERLPKRPVISAFTATATAKVKLDILEKLELNSPFIKITGFDRKNLYLSVVAPDSKFKALTNFLDKKRGKSGMIYCLSRKNVEEVCEKLKALGYKATRYHAGLDDAEKSHNQEEFLYDRAWIMVATNAFGMGIDKSNVNFVVHYNMPKDIESYYQEAGRAGRDGTNAECLLLYGGQDVNTHTWMIENSREMSNLDEETAEMLINEDKERLKKMTFFSTTNDCLRAFILKYFGENPPEFCGACINCDTNFETIDITLEARKIVECVVNLKEKYGVSLVIEVLRGSQNERIKHLGLDTVKTYNSLKSSVKELQAIINFLIQNKYLKKSDGEYKTLKIAENASILFEVDTVLTMKKAKEKAKALRATSEIPSEKIELYEELRQVRKAFAESKGVPAFTIFSDKTLGDICNKMPENYNELLKVNGIGTEKADRYGDKILATVVKYK